MQGEAQESTIVLPLPPIDIQKAFLRFWETTEDDESYDLEPEMMRRLSKYGLVVRRGISTIYEPSHIGEALYHALTCSGCNVEEAT